MIYNSIALLRDNRHIEQEIGSMSLENVNLTITQAGLDAYFDSYYLVQNRRDFLELFELQSKWIIPLISLTISIIALLLSIFKK